jgi:hypothetical protein
MKPPEKTKPGLDATFYEWFVGSQVVTHDGLPLRVFHGAVLGDGRLPQSFSRRHRIVNGTRRPSIDNVGIWLSSRPDEHGAGMYATSGAPYGNIIFPLFARIQKPLEIRSLTRANGFWIESFGRLVKIWIRWQEIHASGAAAQLHRRNPLLGDPDGFVAMLRDEGYDGIILRDFREGQRTRPPQDVFVAFDGEQLRCAI